MVAFSSPYSRLFMNRNNRPNKPFKWWEVVIFVVVLVYIVGQLAVNLWN
jgi:hypothetical protein